MDSDDTQIIEKKEDNTAIYTLAAGLLWNDRGKLLARFPLLCGLAILLVVAEGWFGLSPDTGLRMTVQLLDRALQLVFCGVTFGGWIRYLSTTQVNRTLAWRPLFTIGMGIWLLFALPVALLTLQSNSTVTTVALVLMGLASWFGITYYFYPLPALSGCFTTPETLSQARQIPGQQPLLAVKLLVAPIGFASLLTAIALAPYPDGRSLLWSGLAEIAAAIFWIPATYLSLAASLARVSDTGWQKMKLDPYRVSRLATIQVQAPRYLASRLSPRHGALFLLLGLLVWGGNLVRMLNQPPAPTLTVESATIKDDTVVIQIRAEDRTFHFRGFMLSGFALAGEKRAPVAPFPSALSVRDEAGALREEKILPNDEVVTIELTFKPERTGESLRALEDLWLWYHWTKVKHITFAAPPP